MMLNYTTTIRDHQLRAGGRFLLYTPPGGIATGTAFTASTTDIITSSSHGLVNGNAIYLQTTETLPAGLAKSTLYYARDITDDTFKVATARNGTAVDITDTGSGTHYYRTATLALIGVSRLEKRETNVGLIDVYTMKVQVSNDESSAEFGGITSPRERGTVTIDSEDWDIESIVRQRNFGGMHQLNLVSGGPNELTRESYYGGR